MFLRALLPPWPPARSFRGSEEPFCSIANYPLVGVRLVVAAQGHLGSRRFGCNFKEITMAKVKASKVLLLCTPRYVNIERNFQRHPYSNEKHSNLRPLPRSDSETRASPRRVAFEKFRLHFTRTPIPPLSRYLHWSYTAWA